MKWYWFDKAPPLLLASSLLDYWEGVDENSGRADTTTYWQMLDFLESQSSPTSPCIEVPIQDGKGLIIDTPYCFSWLNASKILVWNEYSYETENIDPETANYFKSFKPENLEWHSKLHWQAVQTDYLLFNSAYSPKSQDFRANAIFTKFEVGNYSIDLASVKSENYWFEFVKFRLVVV
ncbi:hypothetical protein [Spirosoma areae]